MMNVVSAGVAGDILWFFTERWWLVRTAGLRV